MRKRNHVIPVRLNARELRELEEQVEKSGLSREEFMRSLILGAQVHAKPCEHHPELLRKIAFPVHSAHLPFPKHSQHGQAGSHYCTDPLSS